MCFSLTLSADARMSLMQLAGENAAVSETCQSGYAPTLTLDNDISIGASHEYRGFYYKPASNQSVCSLDLYIEAIAGTLTSAHDYYARIYTIASQAYGANLNTSLGESGKIDGDSMSADTWISANAGLLVWGTPIDLTAGTIYAIVIVADLDGGGVNEPPEKDDTNRPKVARDDDPQADGVDSIQYGWSGWDGSKVYQDGDTDDDLEVKVHWMQ